jgi:signal recognition particle subunit SRP54
MLETLSQGFRSARLKLQGKAQLTEDNISDALKDVRISLLEADVELGVVRTFMGRVRERALGEVVQTKTKTSGHGLGKGTKVTPANHFIKICHDELVQLMGPVDASLSLDREISIIMMVGLQGSGKTTTAGKLARRLKSEGKKPLLVAADIYRPAAIDQLLTLGRKLSVPVFSIRGMKPVDLCTAALAQAKAVGRDVVIFDTAGRLALDNELMKELEDIKSRTQPDNILFVCDAMIGQDSVRTAAEFNRRLEFTGFVLTKLDGDARGGAALSIKEVTGAPIKFLGMGEGLDKLDEFRPEGLADRILGFGDVVGLMQDFERVVDKEDAERDAVKMLKGEFGFDDFLKQINMIRKMGSLRSVFEKLPGMGEMMKQIPPEAFDDRELKKVEAMIQSMTRQERNQPDILSDSRMRRVALGSGRTLSEVKSLQERFIQTRKMMSQMGKSGMFGGLPGMGGGGGMPGMPGMPGMGGRAARRRMAKAGGMPGMPGMPDLAGMMPPSMQGMTAESAEPTLSPEDKVAKAKARRAARRKRKRK